MDKYRVTIRLNRVNFLPQSASFSHQVSNCQQALGDNFCLIGEAVAPGFEYEDMEMPTYDELMKAILMR